MARGREEALSRRGDPLSRFHRRAVRPRHGTAGLSARAPTNIACSGFQLPANRGIRRSSRPSSSAMRSTSPISIPAARVTADSARSSSKKSASMVAPNSSPKNAPTSPPACRRRSKITYSGWRATPKTYVSEAASHGTPCSSRRSNARAGSKVSSHSPPRATRAPRSARP